VKSRKKASKINQILHTTDLKTIAIPLSLGDPIQMTPYKRSDFWLTAFLDPSFDVQKSGF
jgi:hypothetical protein